MNLSTYLFWDVDASKISFEEDAAFIIPRVFLKGKIDDVRAVRLFYGEEKLKEILTTTRYLDKKTLAYCCVIFQLNKEDFRCYTKKPFTQKHLNS
ncbi:MAG: hypothetical protein H6578_06835 [Chitinophagales bacterium]|nr:hypothetical protein [Chitinophagales bacterium]